MNDDVSIERIRQEAEQGDVDAQFRLACCYAGGNGVEKNETESEKWMRLAAEQGHADAQQMLGWGHGGGERTPGWNLLNPMDWFFQLVLAKGRWPLVRFLGGLGLVTGLLNAFCCWLFGMDFTPFFQITPVTVILGCLASTSAGIISGFILYEMARIAIGSDET